MGEPNVLNKVNDKEFYLQLAVQIMRRENEPEHRKALNSMRKKYISPVRSRGIFGQQMAHLLQVCPKSRYLWTADGSFTSILSEVEAFSDSRWLNYFNPVQSRGIFGQQMAHLLQVCPK